MANKTAMIGPSAGPGPLWEMWKVEVLTSTGNWESFRIHALNIYDDDFLVLRQGEALPSDQVRLSTIAAFPPHGWHGLKLEFGRADARAIAPIGFRPPSENG